MKSTKVLTILVLVLGLVLTNLSKAEIVGWWKLDEGSGTTAYDSSGNGNHGNLHGDPRWVEGQFGGALKLDGNGDHVDCGDDPRFDITSTLTVTSWIKVDAFDRNRQAIVSKGNKAWSLQRRGNRNELEFLCAGIDVAGSTWSLIQGNTRVNDGQWHHVAGVYDGSKIKLYVDGMLDNSEVATGSIGTSPYSVVIGENPGATGRYWNGLIDDVRIYNNALTDKELQDIMQGGEENLYASNPDPADEATVALRIDENLILNWKPGDTAASHYVRFGSDVPPSFVGNQTENSYDPGPLELDKTYYWRIDEVEADGTTIHRGDVWSFKTGDCIILDDFEAYTYGPPNCILKSWTDGVGSGMPGDPNYNPGNGTGSMAGLSNWYFHGGEQAMGLIYNNTGAGDKLYCSEVSRTFGTPQDLTNKDISLWFKGYPPSVGGFTDHSDGTFTITGSGADIWGDYDEFHFAYKTLTGPGTIIAKVESVEQTDDWAKAGVMIREDLVPGSMNAFIGLTPDNGIVVQHRAETGGETYETNQGGITPPHWLKLERDDAGNFFIYQSGDVSASGWKPIQNDTLQNFQMSSNAYVGLALTSHAPALTGEAVFSNVTITGTVGSQWMNRDIGIPSNDPEPIYFAWEDSKGNREVVFHPDPCATQINTWTQWNIQPDPDVNLSNVSKIVFGVGNPNNPGGWGRLFVDDLWAQYAPEEEPEDQGYPDSWAAFLLGIGREATGDYYDLPVKNCLPACDGGPCGIPGPAQDMNGVSTFRLNLTPPAVNRINMVRPFGAIDPPPVGGEPTRPINWRIFRPHPNPISSGDYMSLFVQSDSLQAGRYVFLVVQFEGDIPLNDDTNSYQYAFVFDADGQTWNNYEPWPDFPNDFFSYTDKWYELTYSPDFGWGFFVTDVREDFAQVQSNALFIIIGSEMAILIPLDEFDIDTPTFRATAFSHTGDFGMFGGPWSGDLSSLIGEPLLPIPGAESVIVIEE